MHGKGMCPMPRPTSRVHVHHQNDQDPGKFHTPRLHYIFALRYHGYVLCGQELQKTSRSGSPQNALHCLVIIGASLSEPHQTSGWPSSLAAILDRRRRRTFNF